MKNNPNFDIDFVFVLVVCVKESTSFEICCFKPFSCLLLYYDIWHIFLFPFPSFSSSSFFQFPYRFWYISLVACYRNTTTCTWQYFNANTFRTISKSNTTNDKNPQFFNYDYEIKYDIHLVNGNPNQSSSTPFTFQFSFDQQNILEMNLIFLTVYLILVPMQIYAVRIQKHPVTKLFTISLILEFISLVFMLSYYIRYTVGGIGNDTVKTAGDILDILSRVR